MVELLRRLLPDVAGRTGGARGAWDWVVFGVMGNTEDDTATASASSSVDVSLGGGNGASDADVDAVADEDRVFDLAWARIR